MISTAEALQKFLDIVAGKSYWKNYIDSQFVKHLSLFQAWALRDAQWKTERAIQEMFLSTALNRPSILAKVEDKGYAVQKPAPATGKVTITNNGENAVSIPPGQALISDSQIDYQCTETATIPSGESLVFSVSQIKTEALEFEVSQKKAFHEILIDKEYTPKISAYTVEVDSGSGYETWSYASQFRNTDSDSMVYDEFHSVLDELGIRFGNGIFGVIPPAGATVRVTLSLTEGNIKLPVDQGMYLVGELLDSASQPANLSIVVSETIYRGVNQEDTESIRRNLLYWPLYNENLVWKEDYEFALRRRFPQIRWINIWGEAEQEAESGADAANINKIFVCLYAEGDEDIQEDVMTYLTGLKLLNKRFQWVPVVLSAFHLTVTGSVARNISVSAVSEDILDALRANYRKDSSFRLSRFRLADVYRIINETGYFTGNAYFSVEVAGVTAPMQLANMISINMASTTATITHL